MVGLRLTSEADADQVQAAVTGSVEGARGDAQVAGGVFGDDQIVADGEALTFRPLPGGAVGWKAFDRRSSGHVARNLNVAGDGEHVVEGLKAGANRIGDVEVDAVRVGAVGWRVERPGFDNGLDIIEASVAGQWIGGVEGDIGEGHAAVGGHVDFTGDALGLSVENRALPTEVEVGVAVPAAAGARGSEVAAVADAGKADQQGTCAAVADFNRNIGVGVGDCEADAEKIVLSRCWADGQVEVLTDGSELNTDARSGARCAG